MIKKYKLLHQRVNHGHFFEYRISNKEFRIMKVFLSGFHAWYKNRNQHVIKYFLSFDIHYSLFDIGYSGGVQKNGVREDIADPIGFK